ncbi:ATP binding protein [Penicillium riverlandense]|uniref:ATP binding protein n=1 Tax=Penicillium riverlandense TaxID=1903569 RepID=UPI002548DA61|nr:ATP binding protein [Penicillium riverlandense]KAJ5832063.1 ATP binding protein [Penicillium riverlandense]
MSPRLIRGHAFFPRYHDPLDLDQLKKLHISHTLPPVKPAIRQYFEKADPADHDWRNKPEFPASEEILGTATETEDVLLAPNKISGRWSSTEEYLTTHYNLVREDAVAPLRDAVTFVREDPSIMDTKDVFTYEKVYIIGATFAHRGLALRMRFSTRRAGKKIMWKYSKRLVAGSVVALSPVQDCFDTKCIVGVVAARPLENITKEPPEIDIFFARPEQTEFDPQQEWIMVEAGSGYYEAYRHTMKALQKLSSERFPLNEHICALEPRICAPEYVEAEPMVDIRALSQVPSEQSKKVNVLGQWPTSPMAGLDPSQWQALKVMLTKNLAIVQGPPGTGKTYVSVVALKVLLSNMTSGDPPIIIAAETNHALDQVLTHVSRFESNYIRLGGRSNDVEIRKRTLYEVRISAPPKEVDGGLSGPTRREHRILVNQLVELLKPFNHENGKNPIPADAFSKHGLINEAQLLSLERGASAWIRPDTEKCDLFAAWLGDQLVAFDVDYSRESFGFVENETDLEYEELKEIEAEHGLEEDDLEVLKGRFVHLREAFRIQGQGSVSEVAVAQYLRSKDLWSIPSKFRGSIYNILRNKLLQMLTSKLRKLAVSYAATCEKSRIGRWEKDYYILQSAKVIGMTTTGLSKYRGLLSSLNPRIVLIEEAAECIEAPIAAACFDSLQQLILVGDHQQLKGHCALQDLASEPFFLEISMFERLVNNGIPYIMLREQRRMATEFRKLLTPIYGELIDHASVQSLASVPGMGDLRSFFFNHDWPESNDSLASKLNEREASMVVEFFAYLALNGVPVQNITVLTFYNGQRKLILKIMRTHPYLSKHLVKVVTVDSYQGEENEIVLLSLVRSSQHRGIGFLSVDSRVCVALSRAKCGFYIFGNANKVLNESPLWNKVVHLMCEEAVRPRLGSQLPLKCQSHGKETLITELSDWTTINGGCSDPCGDTLACGHKCPIQCHAFSHEWVSCNLVCNHVRQCCGVACSRKCGVDHDHPCGCESDTTSDDNAANVLTPEASVDVSDDAEPKEDPMAVARNKWKEFANGGARVQDMDLATLAHADNPYSEEVQQAMKRVEARFIPKALREKMKLVDIETVLSTAVATPVDAVAGHLLD